MGEAKRKRDKLSPIEKKALDTTHELLNKGMIVEGGFAAFAIINRIAPSDPRIPLLHDAFFGGAEHLFSSIMATLDNGLEPTEKDYQRLDAIHKEINAWREKMQTRQAQDLETKGNA